LHRGIEEREESFSQENAEEGNLQSQENSIHGSKGSIQGLHVNYHRRRRRG
jgi:hypothetical protein